MNQEDVTAFIAANLPLQPLALVPEIRLHLAHPRSGLRHLAERDPAFAAPYWANLWAGGLALARFVLDHPDRVAGRDVADFGCGGGLVGIAAAMAGARTVTAIDTDPYALAAAALNARANGVALAVRAARGDEDGGDAAIVLGGDVFYDPPVAARTIRIFDRAAARGASILVGDPWRAPLPAARLRLLADYRIGERDGLVPSRASVFAFDQGADALPAEPVLVA